MTVITEESIRKKIRAKELADGSIFHLKSEDILTPSAKSYLREKQMMIKEADHANAKEASMNFDRTVNHKKDSFEKSDCLVQTEIENEILKLRNLLFLPQITNEQFSGDNWLYFEQQQHWLMNFRDNLSSIDNLNLDYPKQKTTITPLNVHCRIWNFYCSEIYFQINHLLILIYRNKELIPKKNLDLFYSWTQELLKILKINIS